MNSDINIAGRTRLIVVLCFILIIGIVPLIQLIKEVYSREPIQEISIFRRPPTAANLRIYEKAIEDSSIVAQQLRRWFQMPLTWLGKQGNSKVVIGRDGWLFYRPSLDYIAKPVSNFNREFGPLQAIISFHQALKAQGVDLILLPIPGKSTIYPEYLSRIYKLDKGPPVNSYAGEFFQMLKEKGVQVFDPADVLWKNKINSSNNGVVSLLYLQQDTHWSPRGMKLVASHLAEAILSGGWAEGTPGKPYQIQPVEVKRCGDLYDMLNLPKDYSHFEPMNITVEKVVDGETGEPCTPDENSPIVLLGDSFVNVFSKPEIGWGEYGGLAEHLALNLGTPIDAIAINDGGATGSREQFARRPNALMGKRLIIWQFPTRDLVNPESQWKIVSLPEPQKVEEHKIEKPRDKDLVIVGEVSLVSMVPDPSQVAYSECLTYIKYRVLTVEQGEYQDDELIAVFWGMKNSRLMPAARFQPGEKHRLTLDPFEKHEELSHIMQADNTDDYEHTPFWVLEMSPF